MEEKISGFRRAFLGGFQREDVLRYIELTDSQYHAANEALRNQLTETQTALQELRQQHESVVEQNTELHKQLEIMAQDKDSIRAELQEIKRTLQAQMTEMETQASRDTMLSEENDRLKEENVRLAAKCGEYDAAKDKIAEMELSAYRRAKQMEEEARIELQKLRRQSAEMIERLKRQLDTTKENYRVMLARNQQESAEMQRRAGEVLGEIDRITASLGNGKDDGDKKNTGLRDVLNGLRPKMEG